MNDIVLFFLNNSDCLFGGVVVVIWLPKRGVVRHVVLQFLQVTGIITRYY